MTRNTFLFIAAILSFVFGMLMFLIPSFGAKLLGLSDNIGTISVLRGLGGLIIGSGLINFFLRNNTDRKTINALLLTNIVTHLICLLADIWGVFDGALTVIKIAPVEATHLFIGIGSLVYFLVTTAAHSYNQHLM